VAQPQAPAPAAPAVEAPAAPAVDTGKSGPAKPWMAQLKKELQTNELLSQSDDFSSVAEKYLAFEAKKDRLLEIPAQDATTEQKAAFRAKLGVPDKPESYEFEKPTLPNGLKFSEEPEKLFRTMAHELGLNKDQAKALFKFDTDRQLGMYAARQQAQKAAVEAAQARDKEFTTSLEKKWGKDFEVNKGKATEAMKKTADAELMAILGDAKLPSGLSLTEHPKLAEFFFNLDQTIGETPFLQSGKAPTPKKSGFALSPDVLASLPAGRASRSKR
jgi:hypothetical protein